MCLKLLEELEKKGKLEDNIDFILKASEYVISNPRTNFRYMKVAYEYKIYALKILKKIEKQKKYKMPRSKVNVSRNRFTSIVPAKELTLAYLMNKYGDACVLKSGLYDLYEKKERDINMMYRDGKIFVWENFYKNLEECYNDGDKRFIIWYLLIIPKDFNKHKYTHQNIMIYDKTKHSLERFDPHGVSNVDFVVDKRIDDVIVEKLLNNVDIPNFVQKYYRPVDICPIGPQKLEKKVEAIDSDPGGFCVAWSLWYAELRLSNPDVERNDILQFALDSIEKTENSFKKFIRNYADLFGFMYEQLKDQEDFYINNKTINYLLKRKPLPLVKYVSDLDKDIVEKSSYNLIEADMELDGGSSIPLFALVKYRGQYREAGIFKGKINMYVDNSKIVVDYQDLDECYFVMGYKE